MTEDDAATALLLDSFGRIAGGVARVLDGLSAGDAGAQLDGAANSIGWLVWHLTRVQDDHVAELAGVEQVWTAGGWARALDLPFSPTATGFGHTGEEVAALAAVAVGDLATYHEQTQEATAAYLRGLRARDLDQVVDEGWDPPVTLGVRLVSVVSDGLEHLGQAQFVRGVLARRRDGAWSPIG
ncbi:DUF664 domain-containing protein [Pseudactinotalea sp. HY160]|uniref:mycothiol transferase n=1 Tax=Pseudactinotalea sp. HY160 TaxID=2654490 RepID=UPI00128B3ED9|nr:DUF664 domain-containing protein [Pseudactinotalea sp. HY160]MPV49626.1 DUF664 domain-containing protein [Pseudactinotalea sp. HY160]